MDSGVALKPIKDWNEYKIELSRRLGLDNKLIKNMTEIAQRKPQRVVFAEADNYRVLKAAQIAKEEGIAQPILLGNVDRINALIEERYILK